MKRVRTPVRIQLDAAECGAVCLGIVLEHFGSFIPAANLRDRCQVSREGSNAASIVRAAKLYGLEGRGLRLDLDQITALKFPAILHWRMNHFIVLEGITSDFAWINDPAEGRRRISIRELDENFTGVALSFEQAACYKPLGPRVGLLQNIWNRTNNCRNAILFCVLASILSVFPIVAFAVASQLFIDKAVVAGDAHFARPLTWILLACALAQVALSWLKYSTLNHLRSQLTKQISADFIASRFSRNVLFFSKRYAAEIASRVRLSSGLSNAITHELIESICGLIAAFIVLVALFAIHPILGAIVVAMSALICGIMLRTGRNRSEVSQQLAHSEGKLQATVIEAITAIESIKASGCERSPFQRWHHFLRQSTQHRVNLQYSTIQLTGTTGLILSLLSTCVIGGGALLVVAGKMTLGALVAFQLLLPFLIGPLVEVVRLIARLQYVASDLSRFDDVTVVDSNECGSQTIRPDHAETNSPVPAACTERLSSTELLGGLSDRIGLPQKQFADAMAIEVNDLSFRYGFENQPCLDRISFTVPAGQWLGVTGNSGCGKTTLARILARIYTSHDGNVKLNDQLIGEIDGKSFCAMIGYGDQHSTLLPCSIRRHLQSACESIDDESILHALDQVGLKDTISRLPQGLGTEIEEDSLSGGELQRIEIARLLLKKPRVFILDEMTSGLDATTESKVLDAIQRTGATVVFVSHRPSVLERCDQVLFLQDGRLAQHGSHANLVLQDAAYSLLVGEAS